MDPYVYPGTNVLRNLRGIQDAERLASFEADATSERLSELIERPTPGAFDAAHLRAIHRYIFQDLFDWAGEFRTVNITRAPQAPFAFYEQIVPCSSGLFSKLAKEQPLSPFIARTAYYFGELNAIHPFREGNGRTQREFIRQLALRHGYAMDWSRVTRDEMIDASRLSFQRGDNSGLERLLAAAGSHI